MREHLRLAGTSGDDLIQPSCSWKAHPEQMDQDSVWLESGYVQGWRFHGLSKLSVDLPPLSPRMNNRKEFTPWASKHLEQLLGGTFKEGIWEKYWKEPWNGLDQLKDQQDPSARNYSVTWNTCNNCIRTKPGAKFLNLGNFQNFQI